MSIYENNFAKEVARRVKDVLVRLYEWYDDYKATGLPKNENEPQKVGLVDDDDDDEEERLAFLTSQFNRQLESEDDRGAKSEIDRLLLESREVEDNNFDLLGWRSIRIIVCIR
ncbi:hypothetical protein LguiA_025697 [Lonicera macranthoides]